MKTHTLALVALILSSTTAFARAPALEEVIHRAQEANAPRDGTSKAVVVMDLDETLIDSSLRRFLATRDAIDALCGPNREGDCGRVAGLNFGEVLALSNRYDWTPLLDRVGVRDSAWRKQLLDLALKIYLSGKWIEMDQPTPGAAEYVQDLREEGATIFFVTSRWQVAQGPATLASLQSLGMMTAEDRDFVMLRPAGMTSIDFKRQTFATITGWAKDHAAEVVGAFENEPENMNAMVDLFPQATHVFVTGALIKDEPLKDGVDLIEDFR